MLLYKSLSQACIAHSEHSARICLNARYADEEMLCQVRFTLALPCTDSKKQTKSTLLDKDCSQVANRSSMVEGGSSEVAQQTQKLHASIAPLTPAAPTKGFAWFEIESILGHDKMSNITQQQLTVGNGPLSANAQPPPGGQLFSPIGQNLCLRLQSEPLRGNISLSDTCLGILDQNDLYKHVIYLQPILFLFALMTSLFLWQKSLPDHRRAKYTQGEYHSFKDFKSLHLSHSLSYNFIQHHGSRNLGRLTMSYSLEFQKLFPKASRYCKKLLLLLTSTFVYYLRTKGKHSTPLQLWQLSRMHCSSALA